VAVAPRVAMTGLRVGTMVARAHPVGAALSLAALGYIERDRILAVAETLQEEGFGGVVEDIADPIIGPLAAIKRKLSKANRAVKYGMSVLKAGSKATTGADKGKLAKGSFKLATQAAGLANPNTKSTIKKGASKLKSLARKIRAWWK